MRNNAPAQRSESDASDGRNRRRHARAQYAGQARLLLETSHGLTTHTGYVLDISLSGCALHFQTRVDAHLCGRVQLVLAGRDVWLPIVTRWVRQDSRGWSVGAEFDRPTPEKHDLIRRFVSQRT
jgi:PilZ domain